jgi:hypothetical protein
MSSNIERLHYYDREYLRSFDFIAEQRYHMEMRRRLNLSLHLWGIVEGLELLQGVLTQGAPPQFYVSIGMAIDAYGREIVLFAPRAIDEDDLRDNRITGPGRYDVWIAYRRMLATPPSAGYRVCELKDQYTRWQESARLIISNELKATIAAEPGATALLSDDPDKSPWPVLLGSIKVVQDPSTKQLKVDSVATSVGQRTYIGLRTQRIVAPVASLDQKSPDAPSPITVEADLRETKNLIVGEDFTVERSDVVPSPDPTKKPQFPGTAGNLKLREDLFLMGNLYMPVLDKWLALPELIKSSVPEFFMKTERIDTGSGSRTDPSGGNESRSIIAQTLKTPSSASVLVSLSGVQWKPKTALNTWWTSAAGINPILVNVSASKPTKSVTSDNQFDFTIDWAIGSNASAAVNPPEVPIDAIWVSYIAVFMP